MDTFFEQIIPIKKDGKTVGTVLGIWFLALVLCFILFLFSGYIGSIFVLLIAGILYGAFKLTGLFNVEYEYIITNGTMDVDKIVNKQSRKRMLSFELSNVSRLEKYNPNCLNNIDLKKVVFACDTKDDNAYLMVAEKEGGKTSYLVFSPNDKIKSATLKYVPKFISNSAFK
jgi:hypothetical protein